MAQMHFIYADQIGLLERLFRDKIDGSFVVLDVSGQNKEYSTIAQYSGHYDNIKIVSVRSENLDYRRLVEV